MDEYCRRSDTGSYTVRSVYFDSPDFECFHEKLDGRRYREKFRIRTYNQPGSAPIFLEHKRKNGIPYVKRRLLLAKDALEAAKAFSYESLKASTSSGKDAPILEKLLSRVYVRAYSPVALITYDREAYVYPGEETTRVTFDRNLRASMFPDLDKIFDEAGLEYLLYDWIVLEIKFNHVVPHWLRRLNTFFDLRRQACSKYCTCVGYLLGGMPTFKDGIAYVRTS
jgi:SPX domain protein involved in polyphosphate accumulation